MATSSCSGPVAEPSDLDFSSAALRAGNNVYVSDSGPSVNLQSEQSAIVAHQSTGDVLLIAYNDFDSAIETADGLATSSPIGGGGTPLTWPTRTVLKPDAPFDRLAGDPWLAVNADDGAVVYYASVGVVGVHTEIAVARSLDGGQTFGPPISATATAPCSAGVDKESIDTSNDGKSVWVAYRCDNGGGNFSIRVARSTDAGETWSDAMVRVLPATDVAIPSPVVKHDPLRAGNVYVAWEEDTDVSPTRKILFAGSGFGGVIWGATITVVDVAKSADPAFDGFGAGVATNFVHFSFEIDPSNNQCVIAYDVDGGLFFTGSADGVNWSPPATIAADSTTERFQPFLRGTPTFLAVTYYAQPSSGPNFRNTIVFGKMSGDHGATWTAASDQLTAIGGGFVTDGFQACVLEPGGSGYFGDYLGETPLWAPWQPFNDVLMARFYSAWADSRPSCIVQNTGSAIHQHTVGQLWGR